MSTTRRSLRHLHPDLLSDVFIDLMSLDSSQQYRPQTVNPYTAVAGVWDLSNLFRGSFDVERPVSGLVRVISMVDAPSSDARHPNKPHSRARMSWLSYRLGTAGWSITEAVFALSDLPELRTEGLTAEQDIPRLPRICQEAATRGWWEPGALTLDSSNHLGEIVRCLSEDTFLVRWADSGTEHTKTRQELEQAREG